MRRRDLTPAMEDYLREAYLLQERGESIAVQALSAALGVSAPSVTGMVKRLTTLGFMEHTRYRTIALTPAGQAVALEILRHHRLLELYLAEFLGMPWDAVHAEADRLEHHISEDLEERIAARLGHPETDPHGDPIPTRDLVMPARQLSQLISLEPGERAVVARISDQDARLLHYLGTIGLVPGAEIRLVGVAPYGGVVTVSIGSASPVAHAIGGEIAAKVLVAPSEAGLAVTR